MKTKNKFLLGLNGDTLGYFVPTGYFYYYYYLFIFILYIFLLNNTKQK